MSGPVRVGVIGGSGFYEMEGLAEIEQVRVSTPFGDPSDAFTVGTLDGVRVAFLPRHGVGHRLTPTELPARANIWALKSLGAEYVISVSAVGSLRRKLAPLDFVVPDGLIDRTVARPNTFFGEGIVAHVGVGQPFCPNLSRAIAKAGKADGDLRLHRGGTLVVIEGPAFSTLAESELYRAWGAQLVGMTALPEAKLAREAELCYATIACVTDYDVWHAEEEDVHVDMVVARLRQNVERAKRLVRATLASLPERKGCPCPEALKFAFISDPAVIPEERKRALAPIIGRYFPAAGGPPDAAAGQSQAALEQSE